MPTPSPASRHPGTGAVRAALAVSWVAVPLAAGPAVADALADRDRTVQLVVSITAWVLWGVALVALAIPRTSSLTAARTIVPGGLVFAAWAAITGDVPRWGAAGVAVAAVALVLALTPQVADEFVDGSSYGEERRIALRAPATLWMAVVLAWTLLAAALVAPLLLLATGQLLWGAGAALVGVAVAVGVVLRLHQLHRRWLVFVPAGVVVHDPLYLSEPVLLRRHLLRAVAPAPSDAAETGADLTGGALGLALELRVAEPITIGRRHGRTSTELEGVVALLVTPGRPAAALEIAAAHRLPVRATG